MFEFWLSSLHTYCFIYLFLIPVNIEVENGALLHDITWSWKIILGGHGKVMENFFTEKV